MRPAILDIVFVTGGVIVGLYLMGAACRDLRYFHSERAKTKAREKWLADNPDKPSYIEKNEAELQAACNGAANAILSKNAWKYTAQALSRGLGRKCKNLFSKNAWQDRLDTLLGRPPYRKPPDETPES